MKLANKPIIMVPRHKEPNSFESNESYTEENVVMFRRRRSKGRDMAWSFPSNVSWSVMLVVLLPGLAVTKLL